MTGRITIGTELEYGIMPDGYMRSQEAADFLVRHMHKWIAQAPDMWSTGDMLSTGGRLYLDVGHPEYATVEATDPYMAALADHAGAVLMAAGAESYRGSAIDQAGNPGGPYFRLYRNNNDGHGNSYGYHENYEVGRDVRLDHLISGMVPFLVSRQVWAGSGRFTGNPRAPFQISQRAAFLESVSGSQTLRSRPLFNTRDEPHADPDRFRRVHLIGGDANMSETQTLVKLGSTALMLACISRHGSHSLPRLNDPMVDSRRVAGDLSLRSKLKCVDGKAVTALGLQRFYLDKVRGYTDAFGFEEVCDPELGRLILDQWDRMVTGLETRDKSMQNVIDWVFKYALMSRFVGDDKGRWLDPKIALMDLQFHDVRPEVSLWQRRANAERLFTAEQLHEAAFTCPPNTRGDLRNVLHHKFGFTFQDVTWDKAKIRGMADGVMFNQSLCIPDAQPEFVVPLIKALEQTDNAAAAMDVLRQAQCITPPVPFGPQARALE